MGSIPSCPGWGPRGAGTDPAPPTHPWGAGKEPTHSAAKSPSLPRRPQAAVSPLLPSPPSITIQQILKTTLQSPVLLFPGFAGPGSAELSSSGSKMPFKITREQRPL